MHVLRERLVEVSGFAAVMLSQTLLEEPCLSRMFFHNEVSEKHVEQQVCRCCRSRSSRRLYLGPLPLPRRALPIRSDRTVRSPSTAASGRAYGPTLAQAAGRKLVHPSAGAPAGGALSSPRAGVLRDLLCLNEAPKMCRPLSC